MIAASAVLAGRLDVRSENMRIDRHDIDRKQNHDHDGGRKDQKQFGKLMNELNELNQLKQAMNNCGDNNQQKNMLNKIEDQLEKKVEKQIGNLFG
jgi:DNA anti-recombination protein RmuC